MLRLWAGKIKRLRTKTVEVGLRAGRGCLPTGRGAEKPAQGPAEAELAAREREAERLQQRQKQDWVPATVWRARGKSALRNVPRGRLRCEKEVGEKEDR